MTDTIRHMREKRFWRGAAVVGAFLAASSLCAQPVVPKQLATSQHFMVVAAHPLAARAGYDAIRQGGSAVDAAIATALVLGLVWPQSSGLCGGGFGVGGAERFDRGRTPRDIPAAVPSQKRRPGDLVGAVFSAYSAIRREPLGGAYRRWKVCGMPPPSSGGFAVLQILEILERFDLSALKADSVAAVHLFAEAGRLAYADRNLYIADPGFVRAPLAELLESRYLTSRAELIDPLHSMGRARAGNPAGVAASYGLAEALELPATSHISIVDTEGNAVALTASIEAAFGNRQMVRGVFLNNELTDFSWVPEEDGKPVANRVEAKKRPRSSMAPTMVFDEKGKLTMVIGSPGGHSIINYVALTIVNVLDWNMDMQKAIAAPRMGSRNGPTELEQGTKLERLAPEIERMGHSVRIRPEASGLHGIVRTATGWAGGADPRREGVALGD